MYPRGSGEVLLAIDDDLLEYPPGVQDPCHDVVQDRVPLSFRVPPVGRVMVVVESPSPDRRRRGVHVDPHTVSGTGVSGEVVVWTFKSAYRKYHGKCLSRAPRKRFPPGGCISDTWRRSDNCDDYRSVRVLL